MARSASAKRVSTGRGRSWPEAGPMRFERRREEREAADGSLAASYSGEGRVGITRLEVVDRSASGMGVRSRVKIDPGMIVTVCPDGSKIPWLAGRAVRCETEGDGYRVGILFDSRRAA
ncbi:MAG: PilZ domain-containing protein [Phycisphaerales bacterium]